MSSFGGSRAQVEILEDLDALAQRAAGMFVQQSQQSQAGKPFTVALSGGSTPRAFHALLAAPPYRDAVDWSRVQFYWGDERFVAPDDPQSNFRMARETLLDKVPVREAQIHRIRTEMGDPAQSAELYEDELRQEFGLAPGQLPRLDLVFLGMGPDGHTASLFPHTAALHVVDRLVVANYVPKLATQRITMTAPVLNAAAAVAFVVAGEDKAQALASVLEGPRDPDQFPAELIAPSSGALHWLVDRTAAARLRSA